MIAEIVLAPGCPRDQRGLYRREAPKRQGSIAGTTAAMTVGAQLASGR